jgi:hypothetical protein
MSDRDKPMPIRLISRDELPLWKAGEERQRALFELVRDNWYAIKRFAELTGEHSVLIVDRATAERIGAWPCPSVVHYRDADYGLAACTVPSALRNLPPELKADWDPQNVVITVLTDVGGGHFVFSLEHGPPGAEFVAHG